MKSRTLAAPATAVVVDDDAKFDSFLAKADARRAANDRAAKIAAAGLQTERQFFIRVCETPVQVANFLRPTEFALPEDRVTFPRDAVLQAGSLFEVPIGFEKRDLAGVDSARRPLFRAATLDEVATLVSIQVAARFLTVDREAENAVGLEKATLADRARNADLVARARQALENAEIRLASSEAIVLSAGRHRQAEADRLVRWIESSGKSEGDLRAAAALLKPPPPPPYQEPRAHVAPGSTPPIEIWRAPVKLADRESEAEPATVVQS